MSRLRETTTLRYNVLNNVSGLSLYVKLVKRLMKGFIMNILFNRVKYIYTYIYTGEGNGTPLQYSCLENPMDREAW